MKINLNEEIFWTHQGDKTPLYLTSIENFYELKKREPVEFFGICPNHRLADSLMSVFYYYNEDNKNG